MKNDIKLLFLTSSVVFEEEGMSYKLSMLAYDNKNAPAKPANSQKHRD